jgi:hypothetical protein
MDEKKEGQESSGSSCCCGGCNCGKVLMVIFIFIVGGIIGYLVGRLPSRHMMGYHMESMNAPQGPEMSQPQTVPPPKK